MAFLFVPINTAAYAFLPRDKNNAASGLMNLARNIGGSVGISVVTTMLDRRTQLHLNNLSSNLSLRKRCLAVDGARSVSRLHGARCQPGGSYPTGLRAASEGTVERQATMLAYVDCFWFLGVAILAMVPMVFLIKKSKPGGGMAVH